MSAEIQVRFVRGTLWDAKLIEWQTRAWCSHCEAILPNERTLGAMLQGGVKIRPFTDRNYRDVVRWEDWHIPCESYQCVNFYAFLCDQEGKPYDWRAIVSFAMGGRDWRNPNAWFCSELMVAALQQAGLYTPPAQIPGDRLTPRDAYLIVNTLEGAYL
jgi:hypothetical protein